MAHCACQTPGTQAPWYLRIERFLVNKIFKTPGEGGGGCNDEFST